MELRTFGIFIFVVLILMQGWNYMGYRKTSEVEYEKLYEIPYSDVKVIMLDVERWTYSSGFGGGTGALPMVRVNEQTFNEKVRRSGVVYILDDRAKSGKYYIMTFEPGDAFYYILDVDVIDRTYMSEGFVKNGNTLYVEYRKCSIVPSMVGVIGLWLIFVLVSAIILLE